MNFFKDMFAVVAVLLCIAYAHGEKCLNPTIQSEYYTTTDATIVTRIAAVSVFTVSCKNNIDIPNLYVDLNGKIVPAIKSVDVRNKFQVSWTEEPKKISSGTHTIKVYDEEGYAAVRKAQRSEEDSSEVPHLLVVEIYHSGTYSGPWFQSEFVAAVASILIWYWAYTAKSKLGA